MTSLWFSDPYEQRGIGTPSPLVLNVMSTPSARPHTPAACGISAVGEGSPGAVVAAAVAGVVRADGAGAGVPVGPLAAVEPEPPVHAATQASRGASSQRLWVMLIGRSMARLGSLCIVRALLRLSAPTLRPAASPSDATRAAARSRVRSKPPVRARCLPGPSRRRAAHLEWRSAPPPPR